MTQGGKRVGSRDAARSPRDSGAGGLLSYKALTLGAGLLVMLALLSKVAISWDAGHASESASIESGSSASKQSTQREEESQDDPLTPATTSNDISHSAANETGELTATEQLSRALGRAGAREQATAAALRRFAVSGAMEELRSLDREDVVSLADYLAGELFPEQMNLLLQKYW